MLIVDRLSSRRRRTLIPGARHGGELDSGCLETPQRNAEMSRGSASFLLTIARTLTYTHLYASNSSHQFHSAPKPRSDGGAN